MSVQVGLAFPEQGHARFLEAAHYEGHGIVSTREAQPRPVTLSPHHRRQSAHELTVQHLYLGSEQVTLQCGGSRLSEPRRRLRRPQPPATGLVVGHLPVRVVAAIRYQDEIQLQVAAGLDRVTIHQGREDRLRAVIGMPEEREAQSLEGLAVQRPVNPPHDDAVIAVHVGVGAGETVHRADLLAKHRPLAVLLDGRGTDLSVGHYPSGCIPVDAPDVGALVEQPEVRSGITGDGDVLKEVVSQLDERPGLVVLGHLQGLHRDEDLIVTAPVELPPPRQERPSGHDGAALVPRVAPLLAVEVVEPALQGHVLMLRLPHPRLSGEGPVVGDAVGPGLAIAYVHEQHGQGETRRLRRPRAQVVVDAEEPDRGDLAQAPPPPAFVEMHRVQSHRLVRGQPYRKVGLGEVLVNGLLHLAPEVLRGLDLDGQGEPEGVGQDGGLDHGGWRVVTDHERSRQAVVGHLNTGRQTHIRVVVEALEAEALQPRGLVDGRQARGGVIPAVYRALEREGIAGKRAGLRLEDSRRLLRRRDRDQGAVDGVLRRTRCRAEMSPRHKLARLDREHGTRR